MPFLLFLALLLSADNYWNRHTVLAESLARDLSTSFSPLVHRTPPWYITTIPWIYLSLASTSIVRRKQLINENRYR